MARIEKRVKVQRSEQRRSKPYSQLKIAKERIDILFSEASKIVSKDRKLADRYVQLARKIGMRYNVKTTAYRKQYCRKCKAYLKPGVTSRHSIKNGYIIIKCLACNYAMRIPHRNMRRSKKNLGNLY